MTDVQKIIIDQAKQIGDTETVELMETMSKYEDKFGDVFPTLDFGGADNQRMIEIMNDCISKGKDVHEMGYTPDYSTGVQT